MFEFPGAQSAPLADTFAAKLREAVADVATVVRPQKRTTLIISGLDESVTAEEVAAKVAQVGGCGTDEVKAGTMGTGRGGMGLLRLQVPSVAAKRVVDAGRLLVGWVSASVRAVEAEPLRCFRCFCTGHTRPMCPSNADRTSLCYRCGKEGGSYRAILKRITKGVWILTFICNGCL